VTNCAPGQRVRLSAKGEREFPRKRYKTGVVTRVVEGGRFVYVRCDGQRTGMAYHPWVWEPIDQTPQREE
jgi:hypothetical protein